MKNKLCSSRQFALSVIACVVSAHVFAKAPQTPPPYPNYSSVEGIPAASQIPMEARWLRQHSSDVGGVTLPRSFDVSGYWPYMAENNPDYIAYRQTSDNKTCAVPTVPGDKSNDATIERAMQQQGLDIYDGAVWQMALAVFIKNNGSRNDIDDYSRAIRGYQQFLITGLESGFQSYYAYKGYTYNGVGMPSSKNAYLLKFISPTWAANYDAINDCKMQWPEWSAVTGEEAWAVLLGPVQSAYLLNDGANNPNWAFATQAGDFIQLGKNALGAIKQMQSPTGGVYRNVTLPGQPQNMDISLENNFSLYAGLTVLEQALKSRVSINNDKLKSLPAASSKKIKEMVKLDQDDIDTINTIKKGMVKFFAGQGGVQVFDRGGNFFYAAVTGTTPDVKDFAVDVQTWGATVIATSKKDPKDPNDPDLLQAMTDTYGADVMYNMLEAAVVKSAYNDSNNNLLGVGYTEQKSTDSFYELSGEWTLGAVNAAIVLADHYKADASKSAVLIAQAQKMLTGVAKEASSLEGSSTSGSIGYLYANKRAMIPFGWYSNKAPSTASTAWSLLVNNCFNPLELGGGDYQAVCQQLKLGK